MNLAFHASAGTGKTYQVTHLYLSMVLASARDIVDAAGTAVCLHAPGPEGAVDPRRILLMTFTENAAAELRERLTAECLRRWHEAVLAVRPEMVETTARILRRIEHAPIGTIHGFCSSLLRESSLEIGRSPSFVIWDEETTAETLDQISWDVLLERLDPASASYDPDLESFCAGMRATRRAAAQGVVSLAQGLLRRAASLDRSLGDLPDRLPPARPAPWREIASHREALRQGAGRSPAVADFLRLVEETALPDDDPAPMELLCSRTCRKFMGSSSKKAAGAQDALHRALYAAARPAMAAFCRYAAHLESRFEEEKRRQDALDFDDLISFAVRYLRARGGAPPLFDAVIVDEAQDTSRAQYDLIHSLWDAGRTALTVCGDPKQSIYAWRNADPDILPNLEREIREREPARIVPLTVSRRSQSGILDWINELGPEWYGGTYPERDALRPLGNEEGLSAGCVEWLEQDWPPEETPDASTRAFREMEAVARRIRLLVDRASEAAADWQPALRYSEADGCFVPLEKAEPFRYRDILILLRSASKQKTLEHELNRLGIPYALGGRGSGLFSRQEIKDVHLFLQAVMDPEDVLALVGVLRSPLAGLSDEDLVRMGLPGTGSWTAADIREKALQSPDLFEADGPRASARRAIEQIDRTRALLARLPLSAAVRRMIREEGLDAIVAGGARGAQALANLRKLIDWIRAEERGPRVLPADVIRRLADCMDDPPPVPEAPLNDPKSDVVTIMTIHGSKGLTMPVVMLPDLAACDPPDTSWTLLREEEDGGLRFGMKMRSAEGLDVKSPSFDDLRAEEKKIRDREELNLLYVAMTRARDLLVMSGAHGKRVSARYKNLAAVAARRGDLVRRRLYSELEQIDGQARGPERGRGAPSVDSLQAAAAAARYRMPAPRTLRLPATRLIATDPAGFAGEERGVLDVEAALFGAVGHRTLEILARGEADRVEDAWKAACAEEAPMPLPPEWRDVLLQAADAARRETANAVWRAFEIPFCLKLPGDRPDVFLDGVADAAWIDPAAVLHVLDYKFTHRSAAACATIYGPQVQAYGEALRALHPQAVGESLTLLLIRPGGMERVEMAPLPDRPAQLRRLAIAAESSSNP